MIIEMLRTALVPPAEEGTVIFNMEGFGSVLSNRFFLASAHTMERSG